MFKCAIFIDLFPFVLYRFIQMKNLITLLKTPRWLRVGSNMKESSRASRRFVIDVYLECNASQCGCNISRAIGHNFSTTDNIVWPISLLMSLTGVIDNKIYKNRNYQRIMLLVPCNNKPSGITIFLRETGHG